MVQQRWGHMFIDWAGAYSAPHRQAFALLLLEGDSQRSRLLLLV